MKKLIKRATAAALSLALIGGAMPDVPGLFKLPDISMTAEAASGYSYNSSTQTLTLNGSFDLDDIRSYSTKAKKVVSTSSAVFPESAWLFSGWSAEEYDLTLGDFSNVISLESYFQNSKAKSIKIGNSTLKNATTMSYMFYGCSELTDVYFNGISTSKVTRMAFMFYGCSSLKSVDLSSFDTANVINMDCMFYNCSSLSILDLSNFKTSSQTSMGYMLEGCTSLYILDISGMTKFSGNEILKGCDNLYMLTFDQNLDWSEYLTLVGISNAPIDYEDFNDLTGWMRSDDPTCTNVTGEYGNATFPAVTGKTTFLRRSVWTWSTDSFIVNTFSQHMYLHGNVNLDDITGLTDGQKQWVRYISAADDTVFPANCSYMFNGFTILEDVRLNNVDTSNVTNMTRMFQNCYEVDMIDHDFEIDEWDTSNVTYMTGVFQNCKNLKYGSWVGEWDTSNVTNMYCMFRGCSGMLGYENYRWDTSNVTNMSYMFSDCTSLSSIHIENWNTDKVTSVRNMFSGCTALEALQLGTDGTSSSVYESAWHVSSGANYANMFNDCTSLQKLYIYNFQISDSTSAADMLSGDNALYEIGLNRWGQVTEAMKLHNTYGWTSTRSYACVSGTGEYAVLSCDHEGYTTYYTMQGFTPVDLTAANAAEFFTADRPYPGNIADTYTVYNMGMGYTVDNDNSGWYDVDNDCFLSKTDRLMPGGAYIYRVRLVPTPMKYFEQPTKAMIDAVTFADYDDRTMEYLDCVAAHLNDDGTLDIYAVLIRYPLVNGTSSTYPVAQNDLKGYYLPDSAVSEYTYNDRPYAPAYKLMRLASSYNVTPTSIQWKIGLIPVERTFDDCSYELSIDGTNYVSMESMNGMAFIGLAPSTEYTVSVRLAGETESFYSEKVSTADITNQTAGEYIAEEKDGYLSHMNASFSHNVALNNNLGIVYYIPADELNGYDNVKLIIQKEQFNASGSEVTYSTEMLTSYRIEDSGYGDEYVFDYNNIAAKEMGNKVYATVYAEKDNVIYISQIDEYSVTTYAMNKLNKSTTKAALKTLLVDMLNYGAAAQTYFNYNTGNLANSTLTAAQKKLGTSASSLNIASDASETAISSPKAQFTGKNLLLGNNVALVFYMTFDSSVDKNNVTLELSYATVTGETVKKTVPFSEMKLSGYAAGEYEYDLLEIRAKDSCQPVTARILLNGKQISNKITYSVQTYAYNKLNKSSTSAELKTIINALMVYCKSAENYFSA